jgi:uncharacterized protein (TIGR02302 family)
LNEGAKTPGRRPLAEVDPRSQARERLNRLAQRAGLALLWERTWPPAAWALTIVAVFLAASWFGLWLDLPASARVAGVAIFAATLLAALFPLTLLRAPRRAQTLARVDRDSNAPHQPASGSLDRLADPRADEATRALWDLHQRRLAAKIAAIEIAPPAPRMVDRDIAALRFGAVLLAICAAFVAGSERYARVAAAFDWRTEAAVAQGFRIDAWIDPPAYTGKPPILLDAHSGQNDTQKITTPAGSILVLRASDNSVSAAAEGALAPVAPPKPAAGEAAKASPDPAAAERRWTIKGDGKLRVSRNGAPLSTFEITGVANEKPTIALTARPRANARGSLTLAYKLADQYGVATAQADFARPLIDGQPPKGRSLIDPPKMALQLPGGANGVGEAQTTSDLSEHPWAGARVAMTLSAHNIAGEDGASEPTEITLPQRRFANPLARALVEQRRDLVLDPDRNRPRIAIALDALLLAPDVFGTSASIYLGLKSAQTRLADARNDQDLVGVADFLWAMALQIEDGDASQAERDLRAAEQKLREALDRGASDEEIRELMKELRAAAEKFTRELAQQQQQQGDQQDSENLTTEDLDKLLDRMEDTARTGEKAQAQAMLDQLQNLFENMKSAKRGASPAEKELRRQMGELDKLMRDQQALRDETFRRDQRDHKRRAGPNGDQQQQEGGQPQEGQPQDDADSAQGDDQNDSDQLADSQKALRDRLAELQEKMKALGLKGEKGFKDAEGAMGDAEGDLKKGGKGKGSAIGEQGRALEALREGAQGLQKQMQGQGQGEGEGGVEATGKPGEGGKDGRDPLGRDRNGTSGGATDGRLTDAVGAAERAHRVLEELRRRLADPNRPGEERDYLERLLKHD